VKQEDVDKMDVIVDQLPQNVELEEQWINEQILQFNSQLSHLKARYRLAKMLRDDASLKATFENITKCKEALEAVTKMGKELRPE